MNINGYTVIMPSTFCVTWESLTHLKQLIISKRESFNPPLQLYKEKA